MSQQIEIRPHYNPMAHYMLTKNITFKKFFFLEGLISLLRRLVISNDKDKYRMTMDKWPQNPIFNIFHNKIPFFLFPKKWLD